MNSMDNNEDKINDISQKFLQSQIFFRLSLFR